MQIASVFVDFAIMRIDGQVNHYYHYKNFSYTIFSTVIPLIYAHLYKSFKGLAYPGIFDSVTMLVLVPPFYQRVTGATWPMKSHFEPSIIGIIMSFVMWLIINTGVAQ